MADLLNLVTDADKLAFQENYNYKTNFKLSAITNTRKVSNFKYEIERITENGNLPVVALVHALDTEARIGDRPNVRRLDVESLLIKEKLNQTERHAEYLDHASDEELKNFIFDDYNNLYSRILTRVELMNNQLMSTGSVVIDENNYKTTVDYGFNTKENAVDFEAWDDPAHSILTDIRNLVKKAKAKGKTITRALTSSTVIDCMMANTEINSYFKNANVVVTERQILAWIYELFGISFDVNDDVYKTSALSNETKRFFPINKISFFTGTGKFIEGLYAPTPEERRLVGAVGHNAGTRGYITLNTWLTDDPVAVWTKASAKYLPIPKDIDGLFIATVYKKKTV